MRFPGIIPAAITPFTAADRVDVPALRTNLEALLRAGVTGVVAASTVGEAGQLTDAERRTVVDTCVAVAGGAVPVIVGVSAGSTAVACAHAAAARQAGAAGVMCLPPLNYDGTLPEIIAFFTAVGRAGSLPIVAYNNPEAGGIDLTPAVLAEIAGAVDAVVAVTERSGDARRIAALVNDTELEVLVGGDDCALEGFAAGASGWISGVANAAPAECVELHAHVGAGRLAEAREVYRRLLPLARLDMTPRLVQHVKGSMDAVGLRGGPTRPPRLPLDIADREALHAAVGVLRDPVTV
jgi:4-hydroxy-tetrahydrodipicolinate synthase